MTKFNFTLGNKRNIWNRIKNTHSNPKQVKRRIQLGEVIDTSAPKKPSILPLTLTFPASHDTETEFEKQRKFLLATTHDQVSDQLWFWPPLCNPVRTCADLNFVKKNSRKTSLATATTLLTLGITHDWTLFLAVGLNGLRSAKKREEFTWIKEGF